MAKLTISEQDIINAVCVYSAKSYEVSLEDVIVELFFDDEEGFGAEATIKGEDYELSEFHLVQAIRTWIELYLNEDPYSASIELILDEQEGIIAAVN